MSFSRSLFDGIGAGAGVAWPLFGIVSSVLSLGVGGSLAISLGSVCCIVFLAVSIPVFYFAYKKSKEETKQLDEKLTTHLFNFIDTLHKAYLANKTEDESFTDYLNRWLILENEKENKNHLQIMLILFIKKNSPSLLNQYHRLPPETKKENLSQLIQNFIGIIDLNGILTKPAKKELLKVAFLNFVGVFGAVAGCSAGLMGVFIAFGITLGFGANPLLGLGILVLALGLASYSAVIATQGNIEKGKKTQIYKNLKSYNHELTHQDLVEREYRCTTQFLEKELKVSPSSREEVSGKIKPKPAPQSGGIPLYRTPKLDADPQQPRTNYSP